MLQATGADNLEKADRFSTQNRCGRMVVWGALVLAALLILLLYYPTASESSAGELVIHFVNVEMGDASWLHLPNGDDVLIDGGSASHRDGVVELLRANGVANLDLVVITHRDADHIGGLLTVLDELPVQQAWLATWECDTIICTEVNQALETHEVITSLVTAGESFTWGDVYVRVLNPSLPYYSNDNNNSISMRVSYGMVDALFTGDIEETAENSILKLAENLEAEVLKVAHHGSSSSSTELFLEAVNPKVAVISVGQNPYGHPSDVVIQRLGASGAETYRTDMHGTVVFTTDGQDFRVITEYRLLFVPQIAG